MLNQVAFLRILINLFDSAVEDEMNKKRKQYVSLLIYADRNVKEAGFLK